MTATYPYRQTSIIGAAVLKGGSGGGGGAALSLDGTASVFASSGANVSTSGNLTCSNSGNVICVVVTTNGAAVTSVTGTGATFTFRAASTGTNHIELWTGFASGTFNATITAGFVPGSSAYCTIHAFGVNGCPSTNYFDTNAALPNTGTADPATVSTSAADTFIIGAFRFGSTDVPSNGTGFTQILAGGHTLTEYKIVSTTQTSLSVTVGTGAGDANGAIGDALVKA